jgi:hypothetical protein
MTRRFAHSGAARLAMGCAAWLLSLLAAGAAAGVEPVSTSCVKALLAKLDAPQFEDRQAAADQLVILLSQPAWHEVLASEFERALFSANTPLEVRSAVERLQASLPPASKASGGLAEKSPQEEDLDRLLTALDDNAYQVRASAAMDLGRLAAQPATAVVLLPRVKARLAELTVSQGAREQLHGLWQKARGEWLMLDPHTDRWPAVDGDQMSAWVDDLAAAPIPGTRAAERTIRADNAERELLDLLARDDCAARVKRALESRLADVPDGIARQRFGVLIDWTRPAMVAECWDSGRHTSIQHLLLGVPNHSPGAQRASHFDRIDDHSAHCVSGNSLVPGDYPVGVLFPHPRQEDFQFHLVNLPTPRRRMAYEYEIRRDESLRLAEISERTLAALLAEKRPLSEREIAMLRWLDRAALSRFAGPYLLSVDDEPADDVHYRPARYSTHAQLCCVLAQYGTSLAIPGLVEALRTRRILPVTPAGPYEFPLIAMLAIAERDPWPDVDTWLESLLLRDESLALGDEASGEVGATAAALLLDRHAVSPALFGLESVHDDRLAECRCTAYRFTAVEKRERVVAWWHEQKRQVAVRPPVQASR